MTGFEWTQHGFVVIGIGLLLVTGLLSRGRSDGD